MLITFDLLHKKFSILRSNKVTALRKKPRGSVVIIKIGGENLALKKSEKKKTKKLVPVLI